MNGSLDLLRGQFDEFPQQLNSFARTGRQTDLGDRPVLNLVESAHEEIQIGGDLPVLVPAEDLIEKFVLKDEGLRSKATFSSGENLLD